MEPRSLGNQDGKRNLLSFDIQPFSKKDIDQTDEMMRAAYRVNFSRKSDLERYLSIQPNSYPVVARDAEEVAGFGAAFDYGPFSYIGLMAVSPKFQRRGIGGEILRKLVSWLERSGCPTILLDASVAGQPLYEKNGFISLDQTQIFRLTKKSNSKVALDGSVSVYSSADFFEVVSFDSPLFGANRESLLRSYFEEYPERSFVSRDTRGQINGYIVAQSRAIGPLVARDPTPVESLMAQVLRLQFEDSPSVIVSSLNEDSLKLLARSGFELQRSNRHMYKGKPVKRARSTAIFAQATMGFG